MLKELPEPEAVTSSRESGDSDADLAERWQAGDNSAAEALIDRHLDRIRAYLNPRCGNNADADDLTQEVFLAVSRHIGTYRRDSPFSGWLYGIARNKVADFWRSHRPQQPLETVHEGIDERSPARIHEESENASRAWKDVFRLLPEAQASALWLRIQEDLPISEIATALNVTLSNAKVLLFRARQTLATHWQSRPL